MKNIKLKFGAIISAYLLIVGCSNKNAKPTFSQDTLSLIFSEMTLMETTIKQKNEVSQAKKDSMIQVAYNQIVTKYGWTAKQFNENFVYYLTNPKGMDSLISQTLNRINQKKENTAPN